MKRLPAVVVAALVLAASAAHATSTEVYRCGPEGRDFSATPCAEGKALRVDDSRTPAQQHEAEAAARREARLAERLTQERQAREAAPVKGAAKIGSAAQPPSSAASQPTTLTTKGKRKKKRRASTKQDDTLPTPYRAPAK
jgi:hypothetical protein